MPVYGRMGGSGGKRGRGAIGGRRGRPDPEPEPEPEPVSMTTTVTTGSDVTVTPSEEKNEVAAAALESWVVTAPVTVDTLTSSPPARLRHEGFAAS
eukprot:7268122-Prymnesium_polylepis.1